MCKYVCGPVPFDNLFLWPAFVQKLAAELLMDTVFGPIMLGAAEALGKLVDRHSDAIVDTSSTSKGSTFLVQCCLLYRRDQGSADRLCVPAGGGLREQVLLECHDGPLGGHFGETKTGSLVQRLALWVGQDVDVAEYIRTCQTCQHTKAAHGGPRGLIHPLPLPSPDALRLDDRGGLDRRLADDGCMIRHDPESHGPSLG